MTNQRRWPFRAVAVLGFFSAALMAEPAVQSSVSDTGAKPAEQTRRVSPDTGQMASQSDALQSASPGSGQNPHAKPDPAKGGKANGAGGTPKGNNNGTVPEYKPRRWSLGATGSQREDWLSGKTRFDWAPEYSLQNQLKLPAWFSATLEQRTRYETYDVPWIKGQTGGQYQIPLQTVLWMEAHSESFRAGLELLDARQFGAGPKSTLNNTMVDVADFVQIYAGYVNRNLFDTGLGFQAKAGRQTIDMGSRRLIARNAFRNTINAFTGVLMRLRDGQGDWEVQAFATQPVVRLPDQQSQLLHNDYAWDQEQHNTIFTGLFATKVLPWKSAGEIYLYYLQEDKTSSKQRNLYTPGFRVYRQPRKGEPDFEIESIAQVGTARESSTAPIHDVQAHFGHIQAGYTFNVPWYPRFLVQYDYASGGTSGHGAHVTSNSFDTLFGARVFEFGPTGIFGPFARNNISSPGYRLFVTPHRDLALFTAHRLWWMADRRALWQPANLIDPTGRSGDFMGQTVEVAMRWDAHHNFAFQAGWETLIKGGFARNAPGAPANHDNVNYFYVQSQFRF